MAPQPPTPQPITPMAIITTPLPVGAPYTAADGTERLAPCDGVLIQIDSGLSHIVSFFQSPEDAMNLSGQIAATAGRATRFTITEDGRPASALERILRLNGGKQ